MMRNLIIILSIFSVFSLTSSFIVYAEADELTIDNGHDSIEVLPTESDSDILTVADIFSDVTTDHFAYQAIQNLYESNSLHFREADRFLPDYWISRAEFLYMLLSAMDRHPIDEIVPVFNDVDSDTNYAKYIDVAYRLGIIDGYGDGSFKPGEPVYRDTMLKMIITGTGQLKYDVNYAYSWQERRKLLAPFVDSAEISNWAEHYIVYALAHNIITGYPDGTLRPRQYTTRAEAALLIDRFILSNKDNSETDTLITTEINEVSLKHLKEMNMRSTAYNSAEPGLGKYTRSGLHTRIGTVAVDPQVIPLGTHLYIIGYGYAIAADTGGAIKGDIVDLYVASVQEARLYGRQHVTVFVLP